MRWFLVLLLMTMLGIFPSAKAQTPGALRTGFAAGPSATAVTARVLPPLLPARHSDDYRASGAIIGGLVGVGMGTYVAGLAEGDGVSVLGQVGVILLSGALLAGMGALLASFIPK